MKIYGSADDFQDPEVLASRATEPAYFRMPYPDSNGYEPFAFQHAGVEYRAMRRHGIIGDAPGVGKTAQCIGYGNLIGAKRTLVLCPASLRLNWEREIWRWSTIENVATYPVQRAKDGVSPKAHYVIMSYDLLRNQGLLDALLGLHWDHLILDEAHKIKDPRGNKTTTPICAPDLLPSVTGNITLASGTLLPNQPIECYNAVRLLDWDAIDRMSLDSFRNHYYAEGGGMVRSPVVKRDELGRTYTVSEVHWSDRVRNVPTNLYDLQWRLRKHLMVRRLKEDVLPQLPPKQWHPFPIQANADIRKALAHPGWSTVEKLYDLDPDAFERGVPIDGEVATARRLLGEAKAPLVVDYIKELLLEGVEKLVVSAWHKSVLDMLRDALSTYGLVYMDGNTSQKAKQAAVDKFMGDDRIRIILGQMMPLGEGWTLTVAQDVVFAEFDWVPGKNDQLFDRIHRIGQTSDHVIGHVPVVPGSIDERILGTAIEKDKHIYKAMDERR